MDGPCRTVNAAFLLVYPAYAAPNRRLAAMIIPLDSAEDISAVPADDDAGKRILRTVDSLLAALDNIGTSVDLSLNPKEHVSVNDRFVGVFVLW